MKKKKSVKRRSEKLTSKNVLEKKKLKTEKLLVVSLISFLISIVLYFATSDEILEGFFGFIAILSGSLVLLGAVIEIIFFLLKRAGKK